MESTPLSDNRRALPRASIIAFLFACLLPATTAVLPAFAQSAAAPANHQLAVTLYPNEASLEARDILTLYPEQTAKDSNTLSLLLHADYRLLSPLDEVLGKTLIRQGWSIKIAPEKDPISVHGVPVIRFDINKPQNQPWPETLRLGFNYKGPFHDPQRSPETEPPPAQGSASAKRRDKTPKKNEPNERQESILLSGASFFYPQTVAGPDMSPQLVTFSLTAKTPPGWETVSQGRRQEKDVKSPKNWQTVAWTEENPQEEIFLVADRFQKYEAVRGAVRLYAYLKTKNAELANQYLKTGGDYIDFYEKLLGPYPYSKFALVENSRQTGYGMPSFTLLGSQIIRFPFILHTSYPHEILHNWWGNGVYIHPENGNWAEGLTSYLSDHLLAELQGQGEKYRFQELVKYLNYAATEKDFPLKEFKARHDMASQAVGYGKWLMALNMLRVETGDAVFLNSLRHFYEARKFRFAEFKDLQASFETVSGKSLDRFFNQWTLRTGAPEIELADASYVAWEGQYSLQVAVTQKQAERRIAGTDAPKIKENAEPAKVEPEWTKASNSADNLPFQFTLPVAIWFKGKEAPQLKRLRMTDDKQIFILEFSDEPRAVMLDPYYDVFRKLDRKEVPPSIGQTYGSDKVKMVLPDEESDARLAEAYRIFANSVNGSPTDGEKIVTDQDYALTSGESLWVFGKENGIAGQVKIQLRQYGVEVDDSGVTAEGKHFPWADHSFAFAVPNPHSPDNSITWVVADSPESIPGLIRKLPHYGKFGYLAFQGTQPINLAKGVWPAERAGMVKTFSPGDLPLPPKPALTDLKPPR